MGRFMSLYEGLTVVPKEDYFIFSKFENAPEYSIAGKLYIDKMATVTYEGAPWEILKQNNLVYDFNKDALVDVLSVTKRTIIDLVANYFLSPGLILPGSVTEDGLRVIDYSAWYSFETGRFRYSSVGYYE